MSDATRGAFLAGAGAACAFPRIAVADVPASGDEPMRLTPVEVDPGRVIRTTVCLRPFRPDGFVLRRETRGGKPIVHSYGHGGGGVTLSWGVALIGAELASDVRERTAAVVGAGAVGLATARALQDRGFRVSLYAAQAPLDTTSSRAGAQWSPVTTVDRGHRTAAYDELFVRASTLAYRAFQDFVGDAQYGVRWVPNYAVVDDPSESAVENLRSVGLGALYPNVHVFGPGEHPFPTKYAARFETMLIDPPVYLAAMLRDVLLRGAALTIRTFASLDEFATLSEAIVFNCTGLGSHALVGDQGIMPMKGQLSVLLPQAAVDYIVLGPGDLYMFPRADGIVLGGTHERGEWSLTVNESARDHVLATHKQFYEAMRRNLAAKG